MPSAPEYPAPLTAPSQDFAVWGPALPTKMSPVTDGERKRGEAEREIEREIEREREK